MTIDSVGFKPVPNEILKELAEFPLDDTVLWNSCREHIEYLSVLISDQPTLSIEINVEHDDLGSKVSIKWDDYYGYHIFLKRQYVFDPDMPRCLTTLEPQDKPLSCYFERREIPHELLEETLMAVHRLMQVHGHLIPETEQTKASEIP